MVKIVFNPLSFDPEDPSQDPSVSFGKGLDEIVKAHHIYISSRLGVSSKLPDKGLDYAQAVLAKRYPREVAQVTPDFVSFVSKNIVPTGYFFADVLSLPKGSQFIGELLEEVLSNLKGSKRPFVDAMMRLYEEIFAIDPTAGRRFNDILAQVLSGQLSYETETKIPSLQIPSLHIEIPDEVTEAVVAVAQPTLITTSLKDLLGEHTFKILRNLAKREGIPIKVSEALRLFGVSSEDEIRSVVENILRHLGIKPAEGSESLLENLEKLRAIAKSYFSLPLSSEFPETSLSRLEERRKGVPLVLGPVSESELSEAIDKLIAKNEQSIKNFVSAIKKAPQSFVHPSLARSFENRDLILGYIFQTIVSRIEADVASKLNTPLTKEVQTQISRVINEYIAPVLWKKLYETVY